VEQVRGEEAQAVAPASPVRAEEPDCDLSLRLLFEAAVMGCNDTAVLDTGTFSQLRDAVEAELAALRKRVEEGERLKRKIAAVLPNPLKDNLRLYDSTCHCSHCMFRRSLLALAATPEPKEPANG
jgi:hypothetical protein